MKTTALLLSTLLLTSMNPAFAVPKPNSAPVPNAKNQVDSELPSPEEVQQVAKKITVRITSEKNGGSGVLIAKKGSTYLVLTNAHVARRASQFQIQAPDGQKYTAKKIDGGFDAKYDLALLQFTSKTKYTLADLTDVGSPLASERTIYSAGFPFDSKDVRITSGQVTQLSDISFDDGTQIGYTIDKGKKGIRQGMSGGAILDGRGKFLGINTLSAEPITPNYTYNDGSKPLPKLVARYRQANWGVPVYNFLTRVKPDILYGYDNLPKVEHQVIPTGYLAQMNDKARKMTVRIEAGGSSGSGVVIAQEEGSYYVLTAKHVVQPEPTKENLQPKVFANANITTFDQVSHKATGTTVAKGADLAVVKFSSDNKYEPAQLGNYNKGVSAWAFVGGFPGRESINSPLWQWQLNAGIIGDREQGKVEVQDSQSFSNGYDLIYSSISYGGMSGGPVLDTAGNVIGIHGRAESVDQSMLGRSLGLSVQAFTEVLNQLKIKPQLLTITKNPPRGLNSFDTNVVQTARQKILKPEKSSNGERWLAYGNQLHRTRQFKESATAFEQAIAKKQVLKGNYGKALSLRALRKYDQALIAITMAIKVVPKGQEAKYYYFWKYQSSILQGLGKYDQALRAINQSTKLSKNDPLILNEKAGLLLRMKQFTKAVDVYSYIINKNPQYAFAYYNRGLAKYNSGDNAGAIVDYDLAIKINPQYAFAYLSRGLAKNKLGDNASVIADYDLAIKINPQFASAYLSRGLAKNKLGDNAGAIADYDLAIRINPQFASAYNNRAASKYRLGDKAGAIADCDQAIKINPQHVNAHHNRGMAKYKSGDNAGAIADYDLAIKINPQFANAYNSRSLTKSALGDRRGAISDLTKAAELHRQQGNMALYQNSMKQLKKIQGQS